MYTFKSKLEITTSKMGVLALREQEEEDVSKYRKLEVCVDNLSAAIKAVNGGADRLEVCSSLSEGGLTPSIGLVKSIKNLLPSVDVFVMIRSKSGSDFCYKSVDVDVMLSDIYEFKKLNVDGFVFGALDKHGEIDQIACDRVLSAARPYPVTFHRAYDVCKNPKVAIETIISLGFARVLTSGCQPSVGSDEAYAFINQLLKKVDDRIIVIPGCGLDPINVMRLLDLGVREIHASCLIKTEEQYIQKIEMGRSLVDCLYEIDQDRVEHFTSILVAYNNFIKL